MSQPPSSVAGGGGERSNNHEWMQSGQDGPADSQQQRGVEGAASSSSSCSGILMNEPRSADRRRPPPPSLPRGEPPQQGVAYVAAPSTHASTGGGGVRFDPESLQRSPSRGGQSTATTESAMNRSSGAFSCVPDNLVCNDGDGELSIASNFSRMTEVTDHDAMHRRYKESSVCTEHIERHGLKDPVGFGLVCAAVLVGGMTRGIIFPTLWPFVKSLGGTSVTMGYCIAAFSFGRVLTSPVFGWLSVVRGYRDTLLIAGIIHLIGAFMYTQVQAVGRAEMIIVAQCVMGIGTGTLAVTRAYVAENTPKGLRTRYFAYLGAVRFGGFTVTPFFGSLIVWYFRNQEVDYGDDDDQAEAGGSSSWLDMYTAPGYILLLASAITNVALYYRLTNDRREPPSKIKKKVSYREKLSNVDVPEAVVVGRQTVALCGGMSVVAVAAWSVIGLNVISKGCPVIYETLGVKVAADEFGIEGTTVGVTLSICGAVGTGLLLCMKIITKYLSDVHMIVGGMLASVIGFFVMVDMSGGIGGGEDPDGGGGDGVGEGDGLMGLARFAFGIFLVFSVGFPISDTAIVAMFSKLIGNEPQGTLQGLLAASSAVARMVIPMMSGYVERYMGIEVVFFGTSCILAISAMLVFWKRDLLTTLSR